MSFEFNPADEDPHGECRHEIHRLQSELAKQSVCPCKITVACKTDCTCANDSMFGGCDRCCSYGDEVQRTAAACSIAIKLGAYDKLGKRCDKIEVELAKYRSAIERLRTLDRYQYVSDGKRYSAVNRRHDGDYVEHADISAILKEVDGE